MSVSRRIAGIWMGGAALLRFSDHRAELASLAVPLSVAALFSANPGPWLSLLAIGLLPRLAALITRPRLPARAHDAVAAGSDAALFALALLLCGRVGIFASSAAMLLTLRASRPGRRDTRPIALVGAAVFAAAAIAVATTTHIHGLLEAPLLDSLGTLAVAFEASVLLARGAGEPAQDPAERDANALVVLNHELRTPLNAIIGFAGLMRMLPQDPRLSEQSETYARIIESSGEHMLTILEDSIGGAPHSDSRRRGSVQFADLHVVVADCLDMLRPMAAMRGISLTTAIPNSPLRVDGQPTAIQQILINLAANAIKFSPLGAEVEIAVRHLGAGEVAVTVSDRGIGIAASDLAQIGRPYHRGSDPRTKSIEGSGLGLSICKRLADQVGGRLELESREGLGTTARLLLAAYRPLGGDHPKRRRAPTPRPARSDTHINVALAIGAP